MSGTGSNKRTYSSGRPCTQVYKCPVKNCDSNIRGDDVTKHFRKPKFANLDALDKAKKNQSELKKNLRSGDVIKASKEYLENLLKKDSDAVKEHTKYLLHHDYNSTNLPNYNSINFKCQQVQQTNVAGGSVTSYFSVVPKKVMKLSSETDDSVRSDSTESVLEPDSFQDSNADIQPPKLVQNTNVSNDLEESVVNLDEKLQENEISKDEEAAYEFGLKDIVSVKAIDWIAEKVTEKLKKLIEWIPDKVVEKLSEAKKLQKKKELLESQDIWVESDDYWICNPCLFLSKNGPKPMLSQRRGNFGFIKNSGPNFQIVSTKKNHTDLELHKWCVKEYKKECEMKTENDQRNEIASKKIVRNALICFKRSWGSADFVALNAKDFLAERDGGSHNVATKGDSKAEFFRLRPIIFDIVTQKTKRFFEDVENISVTLDKAWTS